MARILMLADAGASTGFATVTQNIGDRLVRDYGHDVSVLAVNWRGDPVDSPMKFYLPTQLIPSDLYGQSRFVELLGRLVPDVIWILNDPAVVMNFMFANQWDAERVLWNGFPTSRGVFRPPIVHYCPIDGIESPGSWSILDQRVTRVAMTKFGRDTAMPEAPVVYHGVDHEVFKPMSKTEAKRLLGYDPDRFLIVRADKQSLRKDYPSLWQALRPVLRRHSDIDVHFHCQPKASDGYDMRAVMWNDEDIRERVSYSANLGGYVGWPDSQLAILLAAADLYVSTSWGEGFGLLNLEAMACGTPVIAQDCSANTEVVGPGGLLVKPKGYITAPMGQKQALPDVDGFTEAIETLYRDRKTRRQLGKAAVEHAAKFTWDYAAGAFSTIIEMLIAQGIARAQETKDPPAAANGSEVREPVAVPG